jgi:hypothetical protein
MILTTNKIIFIFVDDLLKKKHDMAVSDEYFLNKNSITIYWIYSLIWFENV